MKWWEIGSCGNLRVYRAFKSIERCSSEFKVSRSSRAECEYLCFPSYRICRAVWFKIRSLGILGSKFWGIIICHILSFMRLYYIFIKYFKNQMWELLLRFVRMLDMLMQLYMVIQKNMKLCALYLGERTRMIWKYSFYILQ